MNYKKLLKEVEEHVLAYFDTHHDPKLVYHNLDHTKDVVKSTIQIANHYQLNEKDFFIVATSAWFHDTGYFEDANNHEQKSADLAVEFLKKNEVKADIRDQVMQVILSTKMPQRPTNQLENIVCDGDLFNLGTEDFRKKGKLIHKEVKLLYNVNINKREWRQKDIEFLENHQYHTDYCNLLLNDQKQKNLEKLKSKLKEEEPVEVVISSEKEKDEPKLLNKKDKQSLTKE